MKHLIILAGIILSGSVIFSSCTIQKRHSLPGYHVEWKHRKKQSSHESNMLSAVTVSDDSSLLPVKTYRGTSVRNEDRTKTSEVAVQEIAAAKTIVTSHKLSGTNVREATGAYNSPQIGMNQVTVLKKDTVVNDHRPRELNDNVILVLAILLQFTILSPYGVYLIMGKGKEFTTSLVLMSASLLFLVIGIILGFSAESIGLILILLGMALAFTALVYGLIVIIKNAGNRSR